MKLDTIVAVRETKIIYRENDKTVKVFDADFSKADVLNEALNQARVEETGLNIPRVIEVSKVDGKWAIISEYINGCTLAELMEKNPDKLDEYIDLFVDLQLKMHSKKCPMLNKLKDKMNRKISEADIDETTRYELHTRLEGMPKHTKVCHGDFNPTNIINARLATKRLCLPQSLTPTADTAQASCPTRKARCTTAIWTTCI